MRIKNVWTLTLRRALYWMLKKVWFQPNFKLRWRKKCIRKQQKNLQLEDIILFFQLLTKDTWIDSLTGNTALFGIIRHDGALPREWVETPTLRLKWRSFKNWNDFWPNKSACSLKMCSLRSSALQVDSKPDARVCRSTCGFLNLLVMQ